MIECEFFGYERGAFTGADGSKVGLFERAAGGTLFLDEITLLEPSVQVYLVLALQRGTNQDVARMCREGLLRNELYSLLSGVTVHVPSLRERGGEDIEPLAQYFLKVAAAKNNRHINGFSDEALCALVAYPWPGNEQELEHVLERVLTLMSSGGRITHPTPTVGLAPARKPPSFSTPTPPGSSPRKVGDELTLPKIPTNSRRRPSRPK